MKALREEYMQQELDFIKRCEENGYKRNVITSDGNCIFSSVSDQLYGKNYHLEIRKFVCDYIDIEKDYFRPFIVHPQGLLKYIEIMGKPGTWAGDIELQVLSEIYDVVIEIYDCSEEPIKVFNKDASQRHKIVRLLYLQRSHYDSLHKLDEPASVIEGVFGTIEKAVLEDTYDRVAKQKGIKGVEVLDRTNFNRKCKTRYNG